MKKQVLLDNNMFDINYKIAADKDLLFKVFLKNYNIKYLDRCIACFKVGGLGSNKRVACLEMSEIMARHFGHWRKITFLVRKCFVLVINKILSFLGLLNSYYKIKSYLRSGTKLHHL